MNTLEADARPDASVVTISARDSSYELVLPNADSDHIQRQIYQSGTPYELDMLEDMCDRIDSDEVVLDIGANVGNHSLYLACAGKCRVIAFEPNGDLCVAMRESISRNGVEDRIVIHEFGLGHSVCAAQFESAITSNIGAQRLELGDGELRVMPLDSVDIAEKVRALKVDVEGMELDVLRGAERLIAKDRPLIYVECGSEHSFRTILRWADTHSYSYWTTFNFTPTHLLIPAESATLDERIEHLSLQPAIQEYRAAARARRSQQAEKKANNAAQRAESALKNERTTRETIETAFNEATAQLNETLEQLAASTARVGELEVLQFATQHALRAQSSAMATEVSELSRAMHIAQAEHVAACVQFEHQVATLEQLEKEVDELRSYAIEVEHRYLDILDSRTWKVMAPVRTVLRKVKGRPPGAAFVPKMHVGEDLGKAKQKPSVQGPAKKQPVILPTLAKADDLVSKLWGGFSVHAARDLQELVKDAGRKTADRVKGAWHLARWCAASNEWESCLQYMGTISHLDKKVSRSRRSRLLVIEANLQCGNTEKAMESVEYALSDGIEGNLVCALSNVLLRAAGSKDADQQRLNAINDLYRSEKFAILRLLDVQNGFSFGNFSTEPVPRAGIRGPKISVLVPVYNASDFVETAVESLLNQSWQRIEIVAVDDCSTDDSWQKLSALASRDSRLKVFRNERNSGAYPTRNKALSLASGELITVHDSDDWSHPQMLEIQARTLLSSDDIHATFSAMTRVLPNMEFKLRPERNILEYVHRSYPSLMMRRQDVEELGMWDGVAANADDELVQRARMLWGDDSLRDVLPTLPLSFFLRHPNSLTEQKGTHLKSLTFGIRHEYAKQAEFWRNHCLGRSEQPFRIERTDVKSPFPIPIGLAPKDWAINRSYDLVIISDLSLLGGTRRCNEGYIRAATALGLRVGLFHWPRYDLSLGEIAQEYRQLSYQPNVDILVPEDEIECNAILVHHPPILRYSVDAVPRISTKRVAVLVNQLPMQLTSEPPHYYLPHEVDALCVRLFDTIPEWIPISPLTRRMLIQTCDEQVLHDEDWYPPLGVSLLSSSPPARSIPDPTRSIVLGRHSRDHWTKWPGSLDDLRAAYCADSDIDVRLMGGIRYAMKLLPAVPANWRDIPFDQVSVDDFLDGIDVFLHFVHEDYIEEFGRNIVEAMARGVPTILPRKFKETFGDAAIYCKASEVEGTVRELCASPDEYRAIVRKGYDFALRTSDQRNVIDRIARFTGAKPTDNGPHSTGKDSLRA